MLINFTFPMLFAFALLAHDESARRCSLVFTPRPRSSLETALLVSPTRDTMVTGAGLQPITGRPGHNGSGKSGVVGGQIVNVLRFGGSDSARLAAAFRANGSQRVAVVPWDYDAGCQTTRWTAPANWLAVDTAVAIALRVRPESLWINGTPVFDAFHAVTLPYRPLEPADLRMRATGDSTAWLSTDERFEMLLTFPVSAEWDRDPDKHWRNVLEWQRANPQLARRYPATASVKDFAEAIIDVKQRRALRKATPAIRGTYRLTLSLDTLPVKTTYFRTFSTPPDAWRVLGDPGPALTPLDTPEVPTALELGVTVAADMVALPSSCRIDRNFRYEGYVYERTEGGQRNRGDRRVRLYVDLLLRPLPPDTVLEEFNRRYDRELSARSDENTVRVAPGRAWQDNGTHRIEQIMPLSDGRVLTIRGERVSRRVTDCE